MTKKQTWLLIGIIALSVFFRFYQINSLPGGLFPDEAANGLDINLMEQGQTQPFYERGNGREALFFYMLWGSVELFGKGAWQHHAVSALVGVLSVLGCFLLARKLFSLRDETEDAISPILAWARNPTTIALLAAFLMAVSSWHVVLSRTAFRANLIPLFVSFSLYFLLVAGTAKTKVQQWVASSVAGGLFALGFYSYIAYRMMVPIIGVLILWPLLVDIFTQPRFVKIRTYATHTVLYILFFLACIAPIAHYFYTHPGSFVGRSGQVSVFNPELNQGNLIGAVGEVTYESLRAYFVDGDLNWRHNLSGQAFLSPLVSPFFALGLILATFFGIRYLFQPVKRKYDWKYLLLALIFWAMLLPVITTAEGIPHGLRSIGTIPAVFIAAAFGIMWLLGQIHKIATRNLAPSIDGQPSMKYKIGSTAFAIMVVLYVIVLASSTYISYFIYAANNPNYAYAFRSDLPIVSNYLNGFDDPKQATPANKIERDFINRHTERNTYLVLDKFSVQTVDYLTTFDGSNPGDIRNQPYTQVDPENSWELRGLKPGDEIVFTQSSIFDIKKFKRFHPEAQKTLEIRNKFGQAVLGVYRIQ